jgi:hypothetical protein
MKLKFMLTRELSVSGVCIGGERVTNFLNNSNFHTIFRVFVYSK